MEITRVQSLAANGVSTVPPNYIQPPENRPNSHTTKGSIMTVPLIDLSSSSDIREEIALACREWGAFQAINHGIPIHLLDNMRSAGLGFFESCDLDQKLKYSCVTKVAASEGYGTRMLVSQDDGAVLDWRDYFDHHTFPLSRRDPSRWPDSPPNYRKVVEEYSNEMKALASKLLALLSESLGAPSSCIEHAVGEFFQNITISYYPPCPQPELTLGLQSHSDMGAITLLIQDEVGGLEVLKDGEWVCVTPMSDAIVVILADQTEVITNGAYKSAVHRAVTNKNRARLSVATFHDPAKTRNIAPASELLGTSSVPRYREVVYGDYVKAWYTKGPEGKRNIDALLV